VSERTKAWLVGVGLFAIAFAVVYLVGRLIFDLLIVLASIAAGLVVGVAGYNMVLGRPPRQLPWRKSRD
jgi:small neutral amino acid transporter SnatA (MarC family)